MKDEKIVSGSDGDLFVLKEVSYRKQVGVRCICASRIQRSKTIPVAFQTGETFSTFFIFFSLNIWY